MRIVATYGRTCVPQAVECRASHGIEVMGERCPLPASNFEDFHLPQHTLALIHRLGYKVWTVEIEILSCPIYIYLWPMQHPTPVQMQAIPCITAGRDAIVLAETVGGELPPTAWCATLTNLYRDLERLLLTACHCVIFYLYSHLLCLVGS